ncbi:MAG: 1-deoxy-D-xylulose-5-phosphate reductoisomerase [Muribaculaceae bacterium]|nr:1-deoxy-D-xylulose-5-phosphate reductoisomerase [Muribaculaceae bacterium]
MITSITSSNPSTVFSSMLQTRIAVMGSTGSIGTQTLDIIAERPDLFRASVLTARRNYRLLAEQALRFNPDKVVIADEAALEPLRQLLAHTSVKVEGGEHAIAEAGCGDNVDMVLAALVGYSGLLPTINAIKEGKTIALANKETLVVGGSVITPLVRKHDTRILPVDSEHSAIFQCLQGESTAEARKIYLTASGGPFRTFTAAQMLDVTPEQALRHPNWQMGAKVTIDSASMMNKGFEMIEARWLFDCPPEKIEILVHPQSIVHSMVEFADGSVKAQLGIPDMHLPIRYALGYPHRLPSSAPGLTLAQMSNLTFEAPDFERFPLLGFAFRAISFGGNMPCILNAANEVAVRAFLDGSISFPAMGRLAEATMQSATFVADPSLDDLIASHAEATAIAEALIGKV